MGRLQNLSKRWTGDRFRSGMNGELGFLMIALCYVCNRTIPSGISILIMGCLSFCIILFGTTPAVTLFLFLMPTLYDVLDLCEMIQSSWSGWEVMAFSGSLLLSAPNAALSWRPVSIGVSLGLCAYAVVGGILESKLGWQGPFPFVDGAHSWWTFPVMVSSYCSFAGLGSVAPLH